MDCVWGMVGMAAMVSEEVDREGVPVAREMDQTPRPYVPARNRRVLPLMNVLMFNTGALGNPIPKGSQFVPPLVEINTPTSVPTYKYPVEASFTKESAGTSGRSPEMGAQLPPVFEV